MKIETLLLILESILLLATVILLLYSIKEGRGRRNLLLEFGKVTKMLTRQEYFLTVTDAMMEAKNDVVGIITGRFPLGEDKNRVRDIVHNIEKLTANNIKVRYLLPKFHDRLHIGSLYSKAGADVKFSLCAIANNIRFIIVDESIVVIGIPESVGEKEATRKGFRIPSEGLAKILKDYFQRCWEEGITYEDYLKEVLKQTGLTPELLTEEFHLNKNDLLAVLKKEGN